MKIKAERGKRAFYLNKNPKSKEEQNTKKIRDIWTNEHTSSINIHT